MWKTDEPKSFFSVKELNEKPFAEKEADSFMWHVVLILLTLAQTNHTN